VVNEFAAARIQQKFGKLFSNGKRMKDKPHEGFKRVEPQLSTDSLTTRNVTGYGT
jgi:hypothetical protein